MRARRDEPARKQRKRRRETLSPVAPAAAMVRVREYDEVPPRGIRGNDDVKCEGTVACLHTAMAAGDATSEGMARSPPKAPAAVRCTIARRDAHRAAAAEVAAGATRISAVERATRCTRSRQGAPTP